MWPTESTKIWFWKNVCVFVCLSVCLSVCLFVCFFVCPLEGKPSPQGENDFFSAHVREINIFPQREIVCPPTAFDGARWHRAYTSLPTLNTMNNSFSSHVGCVSPHCIQWHRGYLHAGIIETFYILIQKRKAKQTIKYAQLFVQSKN